MALKFYEDSKTVFKIEIPPTVYDIIFVSTKRVATPLGSQTKPLMIKRQKLVEEKLRKGETTQ